MARIPRRPRAPPGSPGRDDGFQVLIAQVRDRSQGAEATLYQRYESHILRRIHWSHLLPDTLLGRLHDPDGVIAETMQCVFTAIRKGAKFPSEASFLNYIGVVATNCCLMHQRFQEAAKRSLSRAETLDLRTHDRADPESDPATQAAEKDDMARFLDSLGQPGRLVMLGLLKGFDVHELADDLHVSVGEAASQRRCVRTQYTAWRARVP
jgi:DNA-directed RNA polymerase specialized sigma24 family protein